jgi:sugar diacid utilization regulator
MQNETEDRAISFFCDVVFGKETDSKTIIHRANLIGFRMTQINYLFLISGENKEIDEKNIYNPYYEIKKIYKNSPVFLYEHKISSFKIAVVFSGDKSDLLPPSLPYQQLLPFLENNKERGWIASISLPFSSVCDLKRAYSQCLAAESLGKVSRSKGLVHNYRDYMGPHLLKQASGYFDISDFCLPVARKIVEYDSANNTDYAATIHVYLCESQNLDATARKMFLHRNSIQYRINKAIELFSIDLKDSSFAKNLMISFEIIEFC